MVMCRGEQWSSFLGQLLGLNEALSNGMDMCWGAVEFIFRSIVGFE